MAVFMINSCKFQGCGLIFSTLHDLIHHIEDTHLNQDQDDNKMDVYEMQHHCVAVSNVLRVFGNITGGRRAEGILPAKPIGRHPLSVTQSGRSLSPAPSLSSLGTTPNGSEMEEDETSSVSGESSIDSAWNQLANGDPNSASALLKMMSDPNNSTSNSQLQDEKDKPHLCGIDGCTRRYRNINGLKYHKRNVHRPPIGPNGEILPPRVYTCKSCGKIYKTPHGLKSHDNKYHKNPSSLTPQQHKNLLNSQSLPPPPPPPSNAGAGPAKVKQIKTELPSPTKMDMSPPMGSSISPNAICGMMTPPVTPTMVTNKISTIPSNLQVPGVTQPSQLQQALDSGISSLKPIPPPSVSAPTLQHHLLTPIK